MSKTVEIIHPYGPKKKVAKECPGGNTRQSMAAECDINNIMAKYLKSGQVTHVNEVQGRYADVPAIDFQEAVQLVKEGQELFAGLNAKTRNYFNNNPAEFLEFVNDDANYDEAIKLGLISPPVEPVGTPVQPDPVVPPEPAVEPEIAPE